MPIQRVTTTTILVLEELVKEKNPIWGLELVRRTGLMTGTVYPILDRLEDDGWLKSEWEDDNTRSGPRRRLYTLTDEGLVGAGQILKSQETNRSKNMKGATLATKPLQA
jgi:DNA-binding PadR family transcriptional regulator